MRQRREHPGVDVDEVEPVGELERDSLAVGQVDERKVLSERECAVVRLADAVHRHDGAGDVCRRCRRFGLLALEALSRQRVVSDTVPFSVMRGY